MCRSTIALCVLVLALVIEAVFGGVCSSTGDPHVTTFDGLYLDNYGVGDYYMVYSEEVTIQARLEKASCSNTECRDDVGFPSFTRAVAMKRKDGARVELDGGRHRKGKQPHVYINGKSMGSNWPANDHKWHKAGGYLFKRGGTYIIVDMLNGFRARVYQTSYGFRDFYLEVPSSQRAKLLGICGNYDGSSVADRELISRSGKTYTMDKHLHYGNKKHVRPYCPSFTRSWYVQSVESLFRAPTDSTFKSYRAQLKKFEGYQSKDIVKNAKFSNVHIQAFAEKICGKLNNDMLKTNCLVDSALASQVDTSTKVFATHVKGIAKSEAHLLQAMIQAAKDKKETKCGIPIDKVEELATLHTKKTLMIKDLNSKVDAAESQVSSTCATQQKMQDKYDTQANKINRELRLIEKIKAMALQFGDHHSEKGDIMGELNKLEARLRAQLKTHLKNKNDAASKCAAAKTAKSILLEKVTFEQKEEKKVAEMKTTFDAAMKDCLRKEKAFKDCVVHRDEIAALVAKESQKVEEAQDRLQELNNKLAQEKKTLSSAQTDYSDSKAQVTAQTSSCKNIGSNDAKKRAVVNRDLALVAQIRKIAKGFSSQEHTSKINTVLDTLTTALKAKMDKIGGEHSSCQKTLQVKITTKSKKLSAQNAQQAVVNNVVQEKNEATETAQAAKNAKNTAQQAHDNKAKKCKAMPRS